MPPRPPPTLRQEETRLLDLLAQTQIQPENFWSHTPYSGPLITKTIIGLIVGLLIMFGMMQAPTQLRKPIVAGAIFIAGLYYVLLYLVPAPIDPKPGDVPNGAVESLGFFLRDGIGAIVPITNVIAAFLTGLGIYSLLRIHGTRIVRQQRDWTFSVVLLVSMVAMLLFGILDWRSRQGEGGAALDNPANWGFVQYGRDFLFEGLLQQMDAAMFSIIAFYILSAAYRAFRVRSIEATILLGTALLVILSLMGLVRGALDSAIPDGFLANFRLGSIAGFISDTFQTPAIRGVQFGVGIGTLAMGLRIWLSLERTTN